LVEGYLKSAFPRARVKARNGCVPATMSEYTSMCLERFVDADVDLVFVEYTVNGGQALQSTAGGRTRRRAHALRCWGAQQRAARACAAAAAAPAGILLGASRRHDVALQTALLIPP
jgi:hypothetical protein